MRDVAYRAVLKTLAGFEAVWRQQPNNVKALERYRHELHERLAALRQAAAPQRPLGEEVPRVEAPKEAKKSTAAPPAGPVAPSVVPSPPEERERRRKATEEKTHLPAGPLGAPQDSSESASLAGVPDEWVRQQADAALAKVKEIGQLLEKSTPEAKPLGEALARLHVIVHQIRRTPPPAPKGVLPR